MTKNKLWLCGMFRGDKAVLEKTVLPAMSYFDGLICVVDDRSTDINWLNSIKKDGEVLIKKWVNDHAHTSNEVLLCGKMQNGDYFVWIDETDELNNFFIKYLRESIEYWGKNNVGAVWIDHPFVLAYHDGLRMEGSPHWTFRHILGQVIDLTKINGYRKENYVINHRDTLKSGFLSPAKYWLCYPNFSNHTQLLYLQFGDQIWSQHESLRIQFRNYCREELNIDLSSLDGIVKYMKDNINNYPPFFEQVLEIEVAIKDIFRLLVLNRDWHELHDNRHNWSYKKYKEQNLIIQPKVSEYVGTFNKYLLAQGKEMQ